MSSFKQFRIIAFAEGLSFIFLLFVSMPLKYYMGLTTFSFYVGLIHGMLFILYNYFATELFISKRIKLYEFIRLIIASIIPFGTFFNDKMLKEKQDI